MLAHCPAHHWGRQALMGVLMLYLPRTGCKWGAEQQGAQRGSWRTCRMTSPPPLPPSTHLAKASSKCRHSCSTRCSMPPRVVVCTPHGPQTAGAPLLSLISGSDLAAQCAGLRCGRGCSRAY